MCTIDIHHACVYGVYKKMVSVSVYKQWVLVLGNERPVIDKWAY